MLTRITRRISLAKTIVLWLLLTHAQTAQAVEFITLVCGYVLAEAALAPSAETKQYEKLHFFLQNQSESYFREEIELIQNGNKDLALSKHEYYRHPNFLAAIKKNCPGYCEYIKALKTKLETDYQARIVRGFEPTRRGPLLLRYPRGLNNSDHYPFYELIKKMHADVLHIDKQREKEVLFLLNAQPVIRLT